MKKLILLVLIGFQSFTASAAQQESLCKWKRGGSSASDSGTTIGAFTQIHIQLSLYDFVAHLLENGSCSRYIKDFFMIKRNENGEMQKSVDGKYIQDPANPFLHKDVKPYYVDFKFNQNSLTARQEFILNLFGTPVEKGFRVSYGLNQPLSGQINGVETVFTILNGSFVTKQSDTNPNSETTLTSRMKLSLNNPIVNGSVSAALGWADLQSEIANALCCPEEVK